VDVDETNIEITVGGGKSPRAASRLDSEENENSLVAFDVVEIRDDSLSRYGHWVSVAGCV
jgi:hypothetical protein